MAELSFRASSSEATWSNGNKRVLPSSTDMDLTPRAFSPVSGAREAELSVTVTIQI